MQVGFYLAGEITQVIDSIPWVRCASGNVLFRQVVFFEWLVFTDKFSEAASARLSSSELTEY